MLPNPIAEPTAAQINPMRDFQCSLLVCLANFQTPYLSDLIFYSINQSFRKCF